LLIFLFIICICVCVFFHFILIMIFFNTTKDDLVLAQRDGAGRGVDGRGAAGGQQARPLPPADRARARRPHQGKLRPRSLRPPSNQGTHAHVRMDTRHQRAPWRQSLTLGAASLPSFLRNSAGRLPCAPLRAVRLRARRSGQAL
jgi:hypothetical protein